MGQLASIPFHFQLAIHCYSTESHPTARWIGATVDDASANSGHTMVPNVCLDRGAGHRPTAPHIISTTMWNMWWCHTVTCPSISLTSDDQESSRKLAQIQHSSTVCSTQPITPTLLAPMGKITYSIWSPSCFHTQLRIQVDPASTCSTWPLPWFNPTTSYGHGRTCQVPNIMLSLDHGNHLAALEHSMGPPDSPECWDILGMGPACLHYRWLAINHTNITTVPHHCLWP